MADLDLDAIEARAKKATPGPWTIQIYGGSNGFDPPEPPEWAVKQPDGHILFGDAYPGDGRDVAFVAHAREDVPALIAALREARTITPEQLEAATKTLALYDGDLSSCYDIVVLVVKALGYTLPSENEEKTK